MPTDHEIANRLTTKMVEFFGSETQIESEFSIGSPTALSRRAGPRAPISRVSPGDNSFGADPLVHAEPFVESPIVRRSPSAPTALAPPTSPSSAFLPLWPSGLAIEPNFFDFGNLTTIDQIGKASRFSRLVNGIPDASQKYWAQTGGETWNIWQMLLNNMELPAGSSGYDDVNRMKGAMDMSARNDPMGAEFYITDYSPHLFWDRARESAWKQITLSEDGHPQTSADPTDLAPLTKGNGTLTARVTQIQLLRSWWSPFIFLSTGWRLKPGALLSALSDGGKPAMGSMPMFATGAVIAKDVSVRVGGSDAVKNKIFKAAESATNLSFGPFALKGQARSASAIEGTPNVQLSVTNTSLDAAGMQILGFMCSVLPKCPNPSPDLSW